MAPQASEQDWNMCYTDPSLQAQMWKEYSYLVLIFDSIITLEYILL